MDHAQLESVIDQAFDNRDQVNAETKGEVREAVEEALALLDSGSPVSYTHLTLPTILLV